MLDDLRQLFSQRAIRLRSIATAPDRDLDHALAHAAAARARRREPRGVVLAHVRRQAPAEIKYLPHMAVVVRPAGGAAFLEFHFEPRTLRERDVAVVRLARRPADDPVDEVRAGPFAQVKPRRVAAFDRNEENR